MYESKEIAEKKYAFDHLSKYADFLIQSSFVDEIIEHNLKLGSERKISILKYLSHLSENELKDWWKKSFIDEFLISFVSGNPVEFAQKIVDRWKTDTVPNVPKDQVKFSDIIIAYQNRKSTLYEFLNRYTQDMGECISILREIDEYFACCEIYALHVYEELKKDAVRVNNEILEGILCNLPVVVTRADNKGILTKSTGLGLKDIGIREGELLGKNIFEVFPETWNIGQIFTDRIPSNFEETIDTREGRQYFTNYFFPNEDGGVTGFSLNITSQKQLEEKLRESEYFIKKIADSIPSHIYVFDYINNKSVYNNVEMLSFLGYSEEQIAQIGLEHLPKVIHPDDLIAIFERHKKYLHASDEDIFYLEYRVKDAKGEYRWHAASSRVFKRTPEGKVWQVLGIAQDITERKKALFDLEALNIELFQRNRELASLKEKLEDMNFKLEERVRERTSKLEESEKRFKQLAEFMPQMVWSMNESGEIDYVNENWVSYTGLSLEESQGVGWITALHPEDSDKVTRQWQESFAQGVMFEVVYRLRRASDGMYRWHIERGLPLKDSNGKVVKWLGTRTDIHDQKTAEEFLEMQARVLNSMDEGVSVTDENCFIVYTNPSEDKIFGYETGELIGKHVSIQNAYPQEENEKLIRQVIHTLKKDGVWSGEWRNKKKDGTIFFTHAYITALNLNDKAFFVCVQRDITEEKKNKEELLLKNKELLSINTDLDNFIYTASHDLKAPVSNIEGLINTLREIMKNKFSEEEEDIIRMINQSIARFKDTIRDLTDVSRIKKNLEEETSEVDIARMVEDVKVSIDHMITQNNAVISLNTNACPCITFSKANFKSIIYNLLTNAIKYRQHHKSPVIELASYRKENYSVIEVRDNGMGIPEEYRDKIFMMFKRMHDHVEGTGIGLYLVKRIVENVGGKIEVESKPGEGSVFKVFLKDRN